MSGLVNKVKEALHSDKSHEVPEGTHGPHNSRVANAADPRVDSDRDHRANPAGYNTSTGGMYESGTGAGYGRTYEPGQAGSGAYETAEGVHGPHKSRIANAADPRVDSDRDHRANPASNMTGGTYGSAYDTTSTTATGRGAAGGEFGTGNAYASEGMGHNYNEGVGGESRRMGAAPGSTFGGTGPAPHTAGPHKSDMMNKMDPRVDSNLDGSKTVGGNKTFGA